MVDESNNTVTNKRKIINEQETRDEDNSINKYDKYPNENFIIKKQKLIEDQLENINNYCDFNNLKSYNLSFFDEFNEIFELSNDKFNSKNESLIINNDIEYCSFDDANNFDNLLTINDEYNNEDFIYYCNLFSLNLLDNINSDNNNNIEVIENIIDNEKLHIFDNDLNLNNTYKINDSNDKFINLNISSDNTKRCASSFYFTEIFDIIFQDLLNILKIVYCI
ncbi:hypothetical protein NAPIS_ORF00110 [Vairimorpha apis BRL 01]|uniref:Uncharacterized protein n=1 Tax=Vairimorpha apis BRL 01 TaxID=1037528 RepID=T0LDD5_9MICR|nr:hypothetical protein NAPIS_ORF00110 [Vairimorpha apis BRL 01]